MGKVSEGSDREILVSIILLTKNGEKYIRNLLDGLYRQRNIECAEIIVIDSGSVPSLTFPMTLRSFAN